MPGQYSTPSGFNLPHRSIVSSFLVCMAGSRVHEPTAGSLRQNVACARKDLTHRPRFDAKTPNSQLSLSLSFSLSLSHLLRYALSLSLALFLSLSYVLALFLSLRPSLAHSLSFSLALSRFLPLRELQEKCN